MAGCLPHLVLTEVMAIAKAYDARRRSQKRDRVLVQTPSFRYLRPSEAMTKSGCRRKFWHFLSLGARLRDVSPSGRHKYPHRVKAARRICFSGQAPLSKIRCIMTFPVATTHFWPYVKFGVCSTIVDERQHSDSDFREDLCPASLTPRFGYRPQRPTRDIRTTASQTFAMPA